MVHCLTFSKTTGRRFESTHSQNISGTTGDMEMINTSKPSIASCATQHDHCVMNSCQYRDESIIMQESDNLRKVSEMGLQVDFHILGQERHGCTETLSDNVSLKSSGKIIGIVDVVLYNYARPTPPK